MKPYTSADIHNAEILLGYTAERGLDPHVRARAKLALALIAILDAHQGDWRAELAREIAEALASGKLTDFNPDAPFNLEAGSLEYLATLKLGLTDGADLLRQFTEVYGTKPH